MAKNGTITLDSRTLERIAAIPAVVAAFPFIGNVGKSSKKLSDDDCGTCGSKTSTSVSAHNRVLQQIHGLSTADKLRMLKILDADRIRFQYQTPAGSSISHTF